MFKGFRFHQLTSFSVQYSPFSITLSPYLVIIVATKITHSQVAYVDVSLPGAAQ